MASRVSERAPDVTLKIPGRSTSSSARSSTAPASARSRSSPCTCCATWSRATARTHLAHRPSSFPVRSSTRCAGASRRSATCSAGSWFQKWRGVRRSRIACGLPVGRRGFSGADGWAPDWQTCGDPGPLKVPSVPGASRDRIPALEWVPTGSASRDPLLLASSPPTTNATLETSSRTIRPSLAEAGDELAQGGLLAQLGRKRGDLRRAQRQRSARRTPRRAVEEAQERLAVGAAEAGDAELQIALARTGGDRRLLLDRRPAPGQLYLLASHVLSCRVGSGQPASQA